MEEKEMIRLWQFYDEALQTSLVLNKKNTEDITRMRVRSALASMRPIKIFTIAAGILWVGFVDLLIIRLFHAASPFFLVSAIIQVLLTKLAIGIYLYQLILIHQVDIDQPILAVQTRIASLKSSSLWSARLLFLQCPVWTTFYWNRSMFVHGNAWLWTLQILVTAAFTAISVWLFINIKFRNKDKKWFRYIFQGSEWNPLLRSIELLDEIQEYRLD